LQSGERVFCVVLDALDEAREPERIAEKLLLPLSSISNIKLLIGTRQEFKGILGKSAIQLHVDRPEYFEKDDLVEYVRSRLLRRGDRDAGKAYGRKQTFVEETSKAVAERAYPNFLIARLVVEDLLSANEPDEEMARQREFPETVGRAFELFLQRFGAEEQKLRDLLTPLAWAEGGGFPWANVWAPVATALSGRVYHDDDIRWVLERAGSFVIEAPEQNRSVYRLFHKALADFLREGRDAKQANSLIFNALRETVSPLEGANGCRDWEGAHPYVRFHIAEHAAASGHLRELVSDILFLLSADPSRLLGLLDMHTTQVPQEIAHVYKLALHNLRQKPIREAASYLEMTARKSGLNELADQISLLPLHQAWSVPWAEWQATATHRVLASNVLGCNVLAVAERNGRTVIISGTKSPDFFEYKTVTDRGMIFVWDLEEGGMVGQPLAGHEQEVTALAIAQKQGRSLIVSGSIDGSIRIWDLEEGRMTGKLQSEDSDGVTALAIAQKQNRTIVVSGHASGRIRFWDLDLGWLVGQPLKPLKEYAPEVANLLVAQRGDQTVIVSTNGSTIHLWDLEQGGMLCDPLNGKTGEFVALWEKGGRTLIVSFGRFKISIWDLLEVRLLGAWHAWKLHMVTAIAMGQKKGRAVLVIGDGEGIRLWDLEQGAVVGDPLTGHAGHVTALLAVQKQGRTEIVSASDDGSIRAWNLEQSDSVGEVAEDKLRKPSALALGESDGRTFVIAAEYHAVRVLGLEKEKEIAKMWTGDYASALSFGDLQGRGVIITGGEHGKIRVWELQSGLLLRTFGFWKPRKLLNQLLKKRHTYVTALAVKKREGRAVIIAGMENGSTHIWDLETGRRLLKFVTPGCDYDSAVCAVGETRGRTISLFMDEHRNIRIWDVEQSRMIGQLLGAHAGWRRGIALGQWEGRTVITSGSNSGTIQVWDLESQELLQVVEVGASVCAMAFGLGSTVLVGTDVGLVTIRLNRK
jgi:WD40 repeat protein